MNSSTKTIAIAKKQIGAVLKRYSLTWQDVAPADYEYTTAERKSLNRGLAQSIKEYNAGKSFGPFFSHSEFISSLRKETKKISTKKNKRAK